MRQADLADLAGVSRSVVSRIECGHLNEVPVGTIRAVAVVLDIRVEVDARARTLDLDRVVNGRHTAMGVYAIEWLSGFRGWAIKPEVSYSEYGERGAIDLLCWHEERRALLVVELKTELLDFGDLLAKLDAKRRLAPRVAQRLGWTATSVSVALLVADSTTNRRHAAAHGALLGAALPNDGRALVAWLRQPVDAIHALRFVADVRGGHARAAFAAPTRVRQSHARAARGSPRSDQGLGSGGEAQQGRVAPVPSR